MDTNPCLLRQAPADGRRTRDACQRAEILREDCEAIARLADPSDSTAKIKAKLEQQGLPLPLTTVGRRLDMMRDDLAQAGDVTIPPRDLPARMPRAGKIAKMWAKYRL